MCKNLSNTQVQFETNYINLNKSILHLIGKDLSYYVRGECKLILESLHSIPY